MTSSKQNPETLAASGFRENDLAGKRVNREHKLGISYSQGLSHFQATKVAQKCRLPLAVAEVVAELAFARCAS